MLTCTRSGTSIRVTSPPTNRRIRTYRGTNGRFFRIRCRGSNGTGCGRSLESDTVNA